MIAARPRRLRRFALLVAVAAGGMAIAPGSPAALIPSAMIVRSEGSAPIEGGRSDAAYQRALEEAFRRGVLDALRGISPERQSPLDLETWQDTVLSRAAEFVGAWRILSQSQGGGFMTLEVEIEIWGEKLARAARSTGAAAKAPAVRVVVFAGSFAIDNRADGEQIDAGRIVAAALEAELARRGAVIVSAYDRQPWDQSAGSDLGEKRAALAAAAARRVEADAVIIAQLTRRGAVLVLSADLVATASDSTLVTTRNEITPARERPLAEAFAPAARQVAAACAPHLSVARTLARRPASPAVAP